MPRGEKLTMGFGVKDGGCVVNGRLDGKTQEIVRMPKIKDLGGHVAFTYSRIVFTFEALTITGTVDHKWCEKEFKRLKKKGTLIEAEAVAKDAEAADGAPPGKDAAKEAADGDKK